VKILRFPEEKRRRERNNRGRSQFLQEEMLENRMAIGLQGGDIQRSTGRSYGAGSKVICTVHASIFAIPVGGAWLI
jgi:hypothetical protein